MPRTIHSKVMQKIVPITFVCVLCWGSASPADTCADDDENCPYWSQHGECAKNPGFMSVKCKLSCGLCSSPTPTPSPSPPPDPPKCATPVECHGALKKKGNRIVDKNGKTVQLSGMSFFWSNWGGAFWNADVVNFLVSQWKISVVRCPMGVSNDDGQVGGGYLSDPNGNTALMEKVVDAAIQNGIYAVIDWHVEGRCDASQSKGFFEHFASKYGNKENVIFETCNEPHGWGWNDGLKSYHEQVIPVIRQHSANLIVAGTNTWSQDVDDASKNPLADPNVAYTLHFYSSMHKQGNRDKASTAMANGAAIFVTEWGTEQNGEGNFDETTTWLNFLRENGISNANWGIYDKAEAWAIVQPGKSPGGGWTDGDLTNSGKFVREYFIQQAGGGPVPTPSPTSPGGGSCSPKGPGVHHGAARGGCDCDCGWATPTNKDDGSCCYACCCLPGLLRDNKTLLVV